MQQASSAAVVTHQQPMHLWDYWGVVMKRLYLVVLFVGAAVFVSWLVTENQEPTYRATATIEIVPPSVTGADAYAPAIFSDDRYLDTQVEKLRMTATIERAVKSQIVPQVRNGPIFRDKSDAEIVRMTAGHVEVVLRRNKLLLDVHVVGSDPRVLPYLANALVREFQEMQRSESRARRNAAKKEIEERIAKFEDERKYAATDKRMGLELKSYDETTFEWEYGHQRSRLDRYQIEMDDVASEISRSRALADTFRTLREKGDTPAVADALFQIPDVRNNPALVTLQRQIDACNDDLEVLRKRGVGKGNEEWQRVEGDLQRLTLAKNRMIFDHVDAFQVRQRVIADRYADLGTAITEVTAKVKEVVQLKALVDQKNGVIARAKEEIALLERRLEPIQTAIDNDTDLVLVTQDAVEPLVPFSPNRNANLTLGAIIGILGGVALAFLLDYLDDTIRTKDELAKIADVPLLGVVPNIEGRGAETAKRDLFAHDQPKSTISEAYRGVRTALTLSAQGPMQKALLLTSAGPREGKTTTAINLATVLAYSGARTLLIDADLRKPRVHKSFGVSNARGLTNLIIGQDDPADYCLPTQVERVDVLPSGPIPPNPSELLGHPRMREIMRRLREKYDHIIVDTPPIGAVTDAAVLATIVDGVILVVHAGKTRRQIVMRGLEQLRYINARIVGVILNNLRIGRVRYYPGYYHYYYYYSQHYGAEESPPEDTPRGTARDAGASSGKSGTPSGGSSGGNPV